LVDTGRSASTIGQRTGGHVRIAGTFRNHFGKELL